MSTEKIGKKNRTDRNAQVNGKVLRVDNNKKFSLYKCVFSLSQMPPKGISLVFPQLR